MDEVRSYRACSSRCSETPKAVTAASCPVTINPKQPQAYLPRSIALPFALNPTIARHFTGRCGGAQRFR